MSTNEANRRVTRVARVAVLFVTLLNLATMCVAQSPWPVILPEQKCLAVRDPHQISQYAAPVTPRPATISDPRDGGGERALSLNEAINIALSNSEVVRVLGGVTASTSGRTIYDTAITNTTIDEQRATFDPQLQANNTWSQNETPNAFPDPLTPDQSRILGNQNENYQFDFGISKQNTLGGTASIDLSSNSLFVSPTLLPLNPADRTTTRFSYIQPLLRGAGVAVNRAPIVLARIETERSFFRYKDAVQNSVQGVIDAYWALVFAKTDVWARRQQVQQAEFANDRARAGQEAGQINIGEFSQTQLALENFRASLLASEANVLQRQAALMNILGLPAYEEQRAIPVTAPFEERVDVDWELINDLAQRHRPDIIELKLILEADQQQLLIADNAARPQLDGVALYQWNGLEGRVPAGNRIRSRSGDFEDWSLGVNFSVPLGLRAGRAALRRQQLLIQRDRANLDQGLHQMQHLLALTLRNLDQFYSQYERFQAVREAARNNLEQQLEQYNAGIVQFIVVLQAIVDWGNAVSSEAQALTQYNTELARLELQTGTILETHGIVFFEERFQAIGPLGRCAQDHCYPFSQPTSPSVTRYDSGDVPAEESFGLDDPTANRNRDVDASDDRGMIDMDRKLKFDDVEFDKVDKDNDGEISDEEIDKILPPVRSSRVFGDFFRRTITLR